MLFEVNSTKFVCMKKLSIVFFWFIAVNLLNAQSIEKVVDSNNVFAFKMFKQLNGEHNLIFSPFSISSALAMTYAGARGETEKQMSRVLCFGFKENVLHRDFDAILSDIESDNADSVKLDIANSLWVQKNYKFLDSYFDMVKTKYHSELNYVDFRAKTEEARKEINNWTEQKTNYKIKDLLPKGSLDGDVRLVLVNALYFHASWLYKFSVNATHKDVFYVGGKNNDTVHANFMNKQGEYMYYENAEGKMIELPYMGYKLSMLVYLPNNEYDSLRMRHVFDYNYYKSINDSLGGEEVELELPKFKITQSFGLGDTLSNMGMKDAFLPDQADFSGMTGNTKLFISKVIHKAFIDVTEDGTEASAATAVVVKLGMARPPRRPKIFKADHPFIYIIRDNKTGSILFMGEVKNPTKQE